MEAAILIADLRARGIELTPVGDRIRFRPASGVPPDLRERLRQHKAEVLELLRAQATPRVQPTGELESAAGQEDLARLLSMPLDVFAREGQPLEVRIPWWPETLFFVPDERHAGALRREGIAPHRVWTAAELLSLPWEPPLRPDALRMVMVARREFVGEVVAVLPAAHGGEARPSSAP